VIWVNPWNNGVPGGDQIAHGLWALATGASGGTGAGLGHPQLIPAGHTDFVLAAIGEELGFVGVLVVVALYALLCWRCLRIAIRAPGDYTALLSIGVALGLMVQALVIAGGIVGLLPLSGVVTPFLSYGRSSRAGPPRSTRSPRDIAPPASSRPTHARTAARHAAIRWAASRFISSATQRTRRIGRRATRRFSNATATCS